MKTKSLFYSYCIFQLRLILSINMQILLCRLETAFGIRSTALQKSVRGCQQLCSLFFSSHVWCSTGLSVATCALCFVHYYTFRHHSKSLRKPSAFCRRHPTSKINSTKWRAKPYTRPAIMYRWPNKIACMCFNAITGSAPSYLSELLHLYSPFRSLRCSSNTRMFKLQLFNLKTHGFPLSLTLAPTSGTISPKTPGTLLLSLPS